MKALFVLPLLLSFLFPFEYHLKPLEVTQGIYCFFGKPEMITKENGGNMVNTCYVTTSEGYVVVDSGPTYQYAAQAYKAMQQIAKLPVKYVITTHEHDDHWLGNSFYKAKGALLIGPGTYEQNIAGGEYRMNPQETRVARTIASETYSGTEIVALDRVVDREPYTFTSGGRTFVVKQPVDQAHTSGDLIVYLPQRKTVFTGDLVFNNRLTSIRHGSIIGSLEAIEAIDALHPEVIITGHGFLTGKEATERQKAYLTQMKTEVLEAIENGVGLDTISQSVVMESFQNEGMYGTLHKRNVMQAYTELEMYEEEDDE